jgi:hypothetical protein
MNVLFKTITSASVRNNTKLEAYVINQASVGTPWHGEVV